MSQSTEFVIGASRAPVDGAKAVLALFDLVGADRAHVVLRTVGESRGFDSYVAFLRGEIDDPEEDQVLVGSQVTKDAAAALYHGGTCLTADVGACPLSRGIKAAMRKHLGLEILGECSLNSVYLRTGNHDIFNVDNDRPVLLGRFFISVTFQADGIPDDPALVLEKMSQLAEFRTFRERFEAVFGKSKLGVLWNL